MDITLKILDPFGYLHFTAVIFRYSYLKKNNKEKENLLSRYQKRQGGGGR